MVTVLMVQISTSKIVIIFLPVILNMFLGAERTDSKIQT